MAKQDKTQSELNQKIQKLEKRISELEENEKRFRLFSQTAFEGIVLSKDGIFIDGNNQFTNMVGYTRDELIGKSIMLLIKHESKTLVQEAIQTNKTESYKAFMSHRNGSTIHVEVMARSLNVENQTLRATAIRDITDQEKAQKALHVSEKKFSTAFHASPDSININRLSDGLYLEINQGFTDIMGYTQEEVVSKTSLELDIWANAEDRAQLVEGLRANGEVTNLEAEFRMKSGESRIGLMSAKVMESNGQPCILSVTRDITAWKKAQEKIEELNKELLFAYDETLEGWSRALDLRDAKTDEHSKRVVEASLILAQSFGIPDDEIIYLRRGAILHDIGKMGIPDNILLKKGSLTEEEWRIMRLHPVFAYEMLSKIPFLKKSLDIPYCHHEKWDGTGYPRGLKGEEIPLSARIFAIADVYDALTSDRPYRPAWGKDEALTFIKENSGSHFDPEIVETFFSKLNKTPANYYS